ncbi:sugar phosphate isomerase/epimerase [Tissierella sp.]|uniref:sugar phosphate isomerase/epimerase family protein n=1 Tax=Tissierella sp. TaxID=41274 RepID=UPI00285B160E|nr:sugar phosphate isomerase/epimerase [Tissierella sp.]MDR7855146.1 sugar phosphate isomerase/epimerase [Tissierella sp.]
MTCKFGMPTLIEKDSILDNALLCKELNLDFIELNMNLPYCMPDRNKPEEILKLKEENNINFTIHFPEEIDFGCFYDEIRQANIILFNNIATWASKFGVEKINIHLNPGIYFTLPKEKVFVYDRHIEMFIEKFTDSMIKIVNIAKPLGIKICVENMKIHEFMEETFKRMVNIENLYFTWDVGHDAMSNYRMKEIYIENPHKVSHMHLHDYNGNSDHQILFEGLIPIKERIKFAKENNLTVVIETKTEEALRKSIERLST